MYILFKCSERGFHLYTAFEISLNTLSPGTVGFEFSLLPFYLFVFPVDKLMPTFVKRSLPCWDPLCQQFPWSMCFSNKAWKWKLIMEILADPYTTGVLACVSVIRNVIRNKRCFWSSISSHEVKGIWVCLTFGRWQISVPLRLFQSGHKEHVLQICFPSKE